MTTFCPKYSRVAFTTTGHKEALFSRLRCKQWTCDYCAAKNAAIWAAFLSEKLPLISEDWWLLTITADRYTRSKEASLKNIRDRIDILMKRVKRVFGEINYVRVYEKHPSSSAIHAHLIVSGLSPYVAVGCSSKLRPMAIGVLKRSTRNGVWSVRTWFKKTCGEIGMGYIIDVQQIENNPKVAVGYVTKYLTKSQQDLDTVGLRHVQTSRAIGGPKNDTEHTWEVAFYITAKMFPPNTKITDLNTGEVIDNNYWEMRDFYPYDG